MSSSGIFVLPAKENKAVAIIRPSTSQSSDTATSTTARTGQISSQHADLRTPARPGQYAFLGATSGASESQDLATPRSLRPPTPSSQTHTQHNLMLSRPPSSGSLNITDEELRALTDPASWPSLQWASRPSSSQKPSKVQQRPLSGSSVLEEKAPISGRASTPRRAPSNLDIHAPNYTPLWLQAVSESVAIPRFCRPMTSLDYSAYVNSFSGPAFLKPTPAQPLPRIEKVSFATATTPHSLTRTNYHQYFYECLQNEMCEQAEVLSGLSMYNVGFQDSNLADQCYSMIVPGLREHSPRIELGDVLIFRQLLPLPSHTRDVWAAAWFGPGGGRDRGITAPGFTGLDHHAIVWGISRSKEEIVLRIDDIRPLRYGCNIRFIVQENRSTPLWRSIKNVTEELDISMANLKSSDWIGRMLFPEQQDAIMQTALSRGVFDLEWYDNALNYEQKKAVDAVVASKYGNVPYLISGPPGTGKTKTLVEMVLQLLRKPSRSLTPHILVCAPSDPAADTIALRLSRYMSPKDLFRLNNWTRTSAEVPGQVLPYTFTENDLFSIPDFPKMMQYKVVVTSCLDADMLSQARLSNRDLTKLCLEMMYAVSPSLMLNATPILHWTALLIDEAAQATEPEALIPMSVVSTTLSPDLSSDQPSPSPQFVMFGDEYQLGPTLHLPSSPLSTSLFARLFRRPFYADHPLSRAHGSKPLTFGLLPLPRPAFTNLIRNYRSHPAILATPSLLFYSDTLIAESTYSSSLTTQYPGWNRPYRWPVKFIQNHSPDALEDIATARSSPTGSSSLFNTGEIEVALRTTKDILSLQQRLDRSGNTGPVVNPSEIAIISPFRAQVSRLRHSFRDAGLSSVNIGPLSAFQGLESRVVILCTTRTFGSSHPPSRQKARDFILADIAHSRGLIGRAPSFNVAMTRAREALFVIGDERALTCTSDECWIQFLGFLGRNGAVDLLPDGVRDDASAAENKKTSFMETITTAPSATPKGNENGPKDGAANANNGTTSTTITATTTTKMVTSRVGRLEAALRFGVEIGDEMGRAVRVTEDETAIGTGNGTGTGTGIENMIPRHGLDGVSENDEQTHSQENGYAESAPHGDHETENYDNEDEADADDDDEEDPYRYAYEYENGYGGYDGNNRSRRPRLGFGSYDS